VFCCFSVRVEQLVYQCSVVSVSEWSNLSTSVLLFQCLSGATEHWETSCSTLTLKQQNTGRQVAPLRHWNNRTLVDKLLHSDTETTEHWSTSVLLFQCLSGATCLPVFCCFSVWMEQLVYQCSVVSVSEWNNLSTSVLLSTQTLKQQNTGRQVAPLRHWNNRTLVDKLLHSDTEVTSSLHDIGEKLFVQR
jgi:transcriptional regulator of met regulon